LLLWLRTTASWAAQVWPRWGVRPARRHWGFHVAAGFWGLPFLLLMGSTALYFAFHEPVAKIVYALTLSASPSPLPRVQSPPGAVSLDALLQRARLLEPAGEFTLTRLPRSSGQPTTINYVLPGDLSDLGANGIHFDPNTGAALRIDRMRDMQLGARVVSAFVPLHFGTFGRTPSRILWALLGTLPSVLFTTGLAIWWRRRSRRSRPEGMSSEQSRFEFVMKDSRL
ncbi:MAG: PepSY-associated TM helix domain-containing protein, partial [Bryobacteraceae bacterium]